MRSSRIATPSIIVLAHLRRGTLFERCSLINGHTACSILIFCASRLGVVDKHQLCGHCVSSTRWTGRRGCRRRGQGGCHFVGLEFHVSLFEVFHLLPRNWKWKTCVEGAYSRKIWRVKSMLFSVVWLVQFVCVCGEKRRAMACSSSVDFDLDCSGMGPRCISCGLLQMTQGERRRLRGNSLQISRL